MKPLSLPRSMTLGAALSLNSEGGAPEWIELIPAGPVVRGRDGREWRMSDPAKLVSAFVSNRAALPIDLEHAQFLLASEGLPAPAYGWVEAVEARNGAIWGRVEWTDKGTAAITSREYRYISPVFSFDEQTREIQALRGAGLVNRPNLELPALNHEDPMAYAKTLAALGLAATADDDAAAAAVDKLKGDVQTALNRAGAPPLDKFVPRADYDTALNRAKAAEDKLSKAAADALEAEITGLVDGAIADGKIAPAAKDYHLASCRAEGGVQRFKDFIAKAPVSDAARASGLDGRKPDQTTSALTDDETAICRQMGVSAEAFLKAKASAAA